MAFSAIDSLIEKFPSPQNSKVQNARGCVEIQDRPSREWWLPRTGAERTWVREHRKRRKPPFAGQPHLNIDIP
ncbi:MAG: hypothetical protein E5Y32_16680 [Mesorhizobium sp.]|nr:MAG: hypothetical protein E5Y73_16225 [Mesorhizobium sp.]TIN44422.1 MAG: hypothetical protein E5Y32_16680 [Mesorhizobium sp.]